MTDLLVKLDCKVLEFITFLVRRWVEKKDFKKHKIDFKIYVMWWVFYIEIVWAVLLPGAIYSVSGEIGRAAFHMITWGMLSAMTYWQIQSIENLSKPLYDRFFAMREDPGFYLFFKEHLEQSFKEDRNQRLLMTGGLLGVTFLLSITTLFIVNDLANSIVWQFIFVNAFVQAASTYIYYVFDFDPPKKKKKAENSITELVARLWRSTVGEFQPQGV